MNTSIPLTLDTHFETRSTGKCVLCNDDLHHSFLYTRNKTANTVTTVMIIDFGDINGLAVIKMFSSGCSVGYVNRDKSISSDLF